MGSEIDYTPLVHELIRLFDSNEDIRALIILSGLDPAYFNLNGKPINIWSEVVHEAGKGNKVLNLIKSALKRYPGNDILESYLHNNELAAKSSKPDSVPEESNPFGLSKTAMDVAEWLYKHDPEGLVNTSEILHDFELEEVVLRDAFEELAGEGLIEYTEYNGFDDTIFPIEGLPLSIPDRLGYNIYEDMLLISRVVVNYPNGISNEDLQKATSLEIPRLNRAVWSLEYKDMAETYGAMGLELYAFVDVRPTRKMRSFVNGNKEVTIASTPKPPTSGAEAAIERNRQINTLLQELKDLSKKEKWEEAIDTGNKLLSLDLNNPEALELTAEAYRRYGVVLQQDKNDFEGALEAFTTAIDLNPKNGNAYYNRGMLHKSMGNYTEYCKDIKEAAKLGVMATLEELRNCR